LAGGMSFNLAAWGIPRTSYLVNPTGNAIVGFTADCLETLEEIAIEGRATFLSAGGKDYHFIPCLNERDTWIRALMMILLENLHGWLPVAWDAVRAKQDADRSHALAKALGAAQ
jgi:protoporphyrin/coproporphyrin ferrochelatase